MKNSFKFVILVLCFCIVQLSYAVSPAPVGSRFSYQGELIDNGVVANGAHDFVIDLYNYPDDMVILNTLFFDNVLVDQGLFNLELDFGDADFNGDEIWMEISVRNSSTAPFGPYSTLTPRQRINAVPYALKAQEAQTITSQNANNGDVYYFDGSDWMAKAYSSLAKWKGGTIVNNFSINYSAGKVGIGVTAPVARLEINEANGGDVFRAKISGITKLILRYNGGVSIGELNIPPTNGLSIKGDVKQDATSNGMMKYMAYAACASPVIGSQILRQFNGTNTPGNILIATSNTADDMCVLTFPTSISSRFWQVSVVGDTNHLSAHCQSVNLNQLKCYRFDTELDVKAPGTMMIFVY